MLKISRILTAAMPWKDVPDADKDEAQRLIDEHNSQATQRAFGFYFVDVSGKYQVYYTLWRYSGRPMNPYVPDPVYFYNLSTDLIPAVKKAIAKAPKNVPIYLESDETRHGLVGKTRSVPKFTFGKYRGQAMPEVYLENPGYFAWLAKNADPAYADTKNAQAIKYFADLYFQEMTKVNLETSTSKFVGVVGEKYSGDLEVYRVDAKKDFQGQPYTVYKLKDAADNKFMVYNLEKQFPGIAVGSKVVLKGKIRDHKELVGIKFTALNYVKAA